VQIQELLSLTYWVDENIINAQVPQKYKQLLAVLQHNVNVKNNQPRQEFKTQTDDLVDAIRVITTNGLTNEQERMLDKLNILQNVGLTGVEQLEGILFRNSLDIATAANELAQIYQKISASISSSNQIKGSLQPLLEIEDDEEEDDHDVVMRVHFQNDVALDNISDFKKWGSTWFDIGRGIAMAHDHAPEDIKVIGAQKGSIIIELAVVAAIAATASSIILSALKVADRVLTIRKKAEEIKSLKLSNKKLESDLEREAEKEKKDGLDRITKELSVTLKIDQNGDGEKVKALEKAVKNLINFVENGGEVDFFADEQEVDDEENPEIEQLRVNFAEIKQLEKRVLAIEHKNL